MKKVMLFSLVSLLAIVSQAIAVPYIITSDPGDGQILKTSAGAGSFDPQDTTGTGLITGIAGATQLRTAIMFFELPEADVVTSSAFSITVDLNDPANGGQHADLWGLGYQPNTTIDNLWSLEGNSDPAAIGGGLGIADRLKIHDNFIDGFFGSPTLPHTLTTSPASNVVLTAYLQSLYDNGAQEGDFAVFRINADFDVTGFDRWRFFSGDASSDQPTLNLDVALVPEPSTFLLLGLGALGLMRHTRRRRRA